MAGLADSVTERARDEIASAGHQSVALPARRLASAHRSSFWLGLATTCAASAAWVAGCEAPKDFDTSHRQVTSRDCFSCHQPDYEDAKAPVHMDLYPKQCGSCHDYARWAPSRFAHPFPLDGRHALTPCWQCHQGSPPVFAGTPSACEACHAGKFESSTFPGHASFQRTCRDCHETAAWKPATGPHPEASFPISAGVHQGYGCLDCHDPARGANGLTNTNCVGCHDGVHDRAVVDPLHRDLGVTDYPSGAQPPNFCASCHPTGSR
jgi:Cytochrome c7 and related cytochrome c/Doubled CXXCH motif (Paired_CXXCH_1)